MGVSQQKENIPNCTIITNAHAKKEKSTQTMTQFDTML
jgi:hypothetical protein